MSPPRVPDWPEEAAQEITSWALSLGLTWTMTLVGFVKDTLGDPAVVEARINNWDSGKTGSDIKDYLAKSQEEILDVRQNLSMYWEGNAHDAFDTWAFALEDVCSSSAAVAAEIANSLEEALKKIVDTYCLAVDYIADCFLTLRKFSGDMASSVSVDPFEIAGDAAEAIMQALTKFTRDTTDLILDTIKIMTDYSEQVRDIKQKVSELKIPAGAPEAASDPSGWSVQPWGV